MSQTQASELGEKLVELLEQQKLLYHQLYELAQKQTELVNGDHPELLLRILAARQRLINRLTSISQQLEPIRAEWNRVASDLPAVRREQVQRLVQGVQDLLAKIIDRDEQDTRSLRENKQDVSQQIRSMSQGRKMSQAYASAGQVKKNRFVDTQSQ